MANNKAQEAGASLRRTPMIVGVTKHSDAYPVLVGTGLGMIPGEIGMPTIDDIKKARAAAK